MAESIRRSYREFVGAVGDIVNNLHSELTVGLTCQVVQDRFS
jgi:hypothetical protein